MGEPISELELPGFRFHPTEEELLNFYLKNMVFGKKLRGNIIGFLNIYNHHPKELPEMAKIGEREWYFFVPRDTKHGSGGRPNRINQHGFWKSTGSDRKIRSISDPKKILGLKKTLVFYEGRAPRGKKTDWIMNEYRLPHTCSPPKDIVLCKIYRKATSFRVLEQRAAMQTEIKNDRDSYGSPSSPVITSSSMDSISLWSQLDEVNMKPRESHDIVLFKEENEDIATLVEEKYERSLKGTCPSPVVPKNWRGDLADLQVPKMNMDWTEDSFWTQLRSPWLDNFTSFPPLC